MNKDDPNSNKILAKAQALSKLLNKISCDEVIGPHMALHGGTAINTFCFDCPRLSGDIDISYIGEETYTQMKPVRPLVLESVKDVARSAGLTAKYGKSEDAGRTIQLYGSDVSFKVDVNFMNRVPLLPPQMMESLFVPGVKANVLSPYDVFGGKLRATFGRSKVRDLYDLCTIGRNAENYDDRLLHGCLLLYATLSERFPQYQLDGRFSKDICAERFGDLEQAIEVELVPMLFNDLDVPTAEKLLEDARGFVERFVDVRDDRDCEYVDGMEHAVFKPELILPKDVAERAHRFPEALWKVKNLQKYVKLPSSKEGIDSQLERQHIATEPETEFTQTKNGNLKNRKTPEKKENVPTEQDDGLPGGGDDDGLK